MEIALIVRDVGKEAADGYEGILAVIKLFGTHTLKQVNAVRPQSDSLVALSKVQFRKLYPGRHFPVSTVTTNKLLQQWENAILQDSRGRKVVSYRRRRQTHNVKLPLDVFEQVEQLAEAHNTTAHMLITKILCDYINENANNGLVLHPPITVEQQTAYTIGQIARIERDLTGNFNPNRYLIEIPKDKIGAVKAYAKTELSEKDFSEKFDGLKGLNLNQIIDPSNYGYFMGGFYGIGIENIS